MSADFRRRYGPWALVTGASDGIGRSIARELAARGLDLLLVARRGDALQAIGADLAATHGIGYRVVAADLATIAGRAAVIDATRDLDIGLLVAAAGFGSSGDFIDGPLEPEREMLAVNCESVLELGWHMARRLAARRQGGIVLLSSVLAFQGVPRSAHYAATKAWVQSFAEGLHVELGALGVSVLASAPGPVATGFARRAHLQMSQALDPDTVAAETLRALGRRMTVRPGWLSKLLGWSLAGLPRGGRVKVLGRVMAGMTAHQQAAGLPKTGHANR